MKGPPAVVLDTNVVVSALVFSQGRIARLRSAWQRERFRPLASALTTRELLRVLAYPRFRLSAQERVDLLSDYLPWCRAVSMPSRPPKVPDCPDPDDTPFLQLALVGKASALVTGDKALLALAPRFACPILRPDAFLATLERD